MDETMADELTTADAAQLAGVSPRTVREWHSQQKIAGRKTAAGLLVERRSLEARIRQRGGATADPSATPAEPSADLAALAREALDVLRAELAANRTERQRLTDENERLAGQVGYLEAKVQERDAQILQLTAGAAETAEGAKESGSSYSPITDEGSTHAESIAHAADGAADAPPPEAGPADGPPWWARLRHWWGGMVV